MSDTPDDLKYTKTHEWIRTMADGVVEVGITDHAQQLMGDMVFVELPEVDAEYGAGDDCAVVESVKAASDVYAPVGGRVVEVNSSLNDTPEAVNRDPYGDGWIFRMRLEDAEDLAELLSAQAYQAQAAQEE